MRCTFSKTKVELVTIIVIKLNLSGLQDGRDRAECVIEVISSSPWPRFRLTRGTFDISVLRAHPRPITSESLRFQSECQYFKAPREMLLCHQG